MIISMFAFGCVLTSLTKKCLFTPKLTMIVKNKKTLHGLVCDVNNIRRRDLKKVSLFSDNINLVIDLIGTYV